MLIVYFLLEALGGSTIAAGIALLFCMMWQLTAEQRPVRLLDILLMGFMIGTGFALTALAARI